MNKGVFIFCCVLLSSTGFSQPANDDCANAQSLTIDGGMSCGWQPSGADDQTGECTANYAGGQPATMWFSFTASNDSLVFNSINTNGTAGYYINLYGPNPSCVPGCGSQVSSTLANGDPGAHILFTGLTVGANYLIQIDAPDWNGPGLPTQNLCVALYNPADNSGSAGAALIDECGTAFNESTDGGYWNNGTGTGFGNLDNNAGTTCPTCGTAGNDVPYVINNVAWTYFCSLTAGTWQITVNGVSNCTLAAPNQGVQATVFSGTSNSLVYEDHQSPIAPGASWTSNTITVNAGECAYLTIDGFAGDICDYSVTLTNITGGCVILSVNFLGLDAYYSDEGVVLNWKVGSESNNDKFIIERSSDGTNFYPIGEVPSIGDHSSVHEYQFVDNRFSSENLYYRLSMIDQNGKIEQLAYKYFIINPTQEDLQVYPNPTEGALHVKYICKKMNENTTIEVYNLQGELMISNNYRLEGGENDLELDVTDLAEGKYILRVITDAGVQTISFLKR